MTRFVEGYHLQLGKVCWRKSLQWWQYLLKVIPSFCNNGNICWRMLSGRMALFVEESHLHLGKMCWRMPSALMTRFVEGYLYIDCNSCGGIPPAMMARVLKDTICNDGKICWRIPSAMMVRLVEGYHFHSADLWKDAICIVFLDEREFLALQVFCRLSAPIRCMPNQLCVCSKC